ncbi:hypothetical protein AKJ16_DCAP21825 [Drosera capensis]
MEKVRKPGPRQFECVRRAWHSDRHQPMRGSIIQQIFRVVNEAHSAGVRKNREWQEKLPVVVLKAEEIMYSKANSEAEYMNHDTLWNRLNDAVDTIIRRDESTETGGQFLQPCIEAALVLGCVPVRASRSQRTNIRSYLTPRAQDPTTVNPAAAPAASAVSENVSHPRPTSTPQPSHPSCQQSSMPRPVMANQPSSSSRPEGLNPQFMNRMAVHNVPMLHPNVLQGVVTSLPFDSSTAMKFSSGYPLYFGAQLRPLEPQFGLHLRQNSNPSNIFVGTPVSWSRAEAAHVGTTRNLFSCDSEANAEDKFREGKGNPQGDQVKAPEIDCDLSLRLGPSSDTRRLPQEIRDCGESSCIEGRSSILESISRNREFCFFPHGDANVPSEPLPGNEGEVLKKRKAPLRQDDDDVYTRWRLDSGSSQIPGGMRWRDFAGLVGLLEVERSIQIGDVDMEDDGADATVYKKLDT